jgi:hypothetical protein
VDRPDQLVALGLALSYLDLALMDDVARLSSERADGSPRDRLLVEHLAGCAAACRHDAVAALAHLESAEKLADAQLDLWRLGHVRQMRGLAHAVLTRAALLPRSQVEEDLREVVEVSPRSATCAA